MWIRQACSLSHYIEVKGATVFDEDNHFVHKDANKTYASRRYVPIFIPQLQDALEKVDKKVGGVICYTTPSGLWKAINRMCKKKNLPCVGLHGLRHSFASLAVHLNVPEETAMIIGGWSDFHTMRKIYTHISHKDMQTHTEAFTAFYRNAN